MRRIVKDKSFGSDFQSWVQRARLNTWDEFHVFVKQTSSGKYDELILHLMAEQEWFCAYTEKPLSMKGGVTHIDHFRKREWFRRDTFDYDNLFVSDHNPNYGADYKDCKVCEEDYQILISPLKGLTDKISFDFSGEMNVLESIEERDREATDKTIQLFNLNHPSLVSIRERLIQNIRMYRTYGLSDSEIRDALKDQGFPSLIEWVLDNLKEVDIEENG